MRFRYLHFVLLFTGLAGTLVALNNASLLQSAREELRLVTELAGFVRIADPNKICFVRFNGVAPGQFAWRFYIPPGSRAGPWD